MQESKGHLEDCATFVVSDEAQQYGQLPREALADVVATLDATRLNLGDPAQPKTASNEISSGLFRTSHASAFEVPSMRLASDLSLQALPLPKRKSFGQLSWAPWIRNGRPPTRTSGNGWSA